VAGKSGANGEPAGRVGPAWYQTYGKARGKATWGQVQRHKPGHWLDAGSLESDYRDMLVQVRQRIEVLIAAGKTIDEAVAAAPTNDFDSKWGRGYVTPDVFTRLVFSSLTLPSSGRR